MSSTSGSDRHNNGGILRRPGLAAGVASVVFKPGNVNVTVGGMAAFYSVALSCSIAPEQRVTIAPANLPTLLRVLPALHIFTPENWRQPQYFRIAAISSAVTEDLRGGGVVIEHTISSMDQRFHGRRVIHVPNAVHVHINPRDGGCLFATGKCKATLSQQQEEVQLRPKQTATQHEFTEVKLQRTSGARPLVARSSILMSMAPGAVAAVAAVEAANHATAQVTELQTRRRLSAAASAIDAVAATLDPAIVVEPATATRAALDNNNTLIKLAGRANRTLVLYNDGELVTLGSSETSSTDTFSRRESGADAALTRMLLDVACGDSHMAATSEQGYLLTWGDVRECRVNNPTKEPATAVKWPKVVQSLLHKRVMQVACGASHSFALAEDGDVFSWGLGHSGALGHGLNAHEQTFETVPSPMEVLSLKGRRVVQIGCGDMHSAALLADGELLTCGLRVHGRLGRQSSSTTKQMTDLQGTDCDESSSWFAPVTFPREGLKCTYVACGSAHTLAVGGPNELYAFGWNACGQLGLGDCRDRHVPTRVAYFDEISQNRGASLPPLDIASVCAGKLHSLASSPDGRLFAWGNDEMGQCGLSSCPQIYTLPHLVKSLVGLRVTQLAAGEAHSAVLTSHAQRHLDVLERTQPTQYAQLVEYYECAVKDDTQRRSLVLDRARRQQLERAASARRRKPPMDPAANELAKMLLLQALVDQDAALDEKRSQQLRRPQTARAIMAQRAVAINANQQHVHCSSASIVRQARLSVLQAPLSVTTLGQVPRASSTADLSSFKPKSMTSLRRPVSAASHRKQRRPKTASSG